MELPQYFGQLTNSYVFVGTGQKEFDYPAGDRNVYTNYTGRGGVARVDATIGDEVLRLDTTALLVAPLRGSFSTPELYCVAKVVLFNPNSRP